MLPDFLILGAPRCATTSLANALDEHPDVFVPDVKEIGFFQADKHWNRGPDWYEQFFEPATEQALVSGEATPYYFQSERASERICEVLPDVRMIVILRDPVERAQSHFFARKRFREEEREFGVAVREAIRVESEKEYFLKQSCYERGLENYFERFSRDQIEVVIFERLLAEPSERLRELQTFLGLSPVELKLPKENQSKQPRSETFRRVWKGLASLSGPVKRMFRACTTRTVRKRIFRTVRDWNMTEASKPEVEKEVRELLRKYFTDEIERVRELLDDDLPEWDSSMGT